MSELFSFTVETRPSPPVAARAGRLFLPHGPVATPIFMPVATQAALKGLTVAQLEALEVEIILGNTYHLGLRPGEQVFREITRRKNAARANPEQGRDPEQDPVRDNMDGVHFFEGWRRNVLTDSGGFQMVSLLKLAEITEEGVRFQSTHGGGGRAAVGPQKEDIDEAGAKNPYSLLLRPEDSIGIQNAIGADIMMQLDDVVHVLTTGPRVEEAAKRSLRWLDRSLAANANPEKQCIFGIVQGALDPELRRECLREITKRTACKGFAIGGLSGGEAKDDFWRIVRLCTSEGGLPEDKPRYCMGVGYPEDILVCIALGVDMFDCVFACRTARFGSALTSTGKIHLGKRQYANDPAPLDAACNCMTCKTYTRAYLHTISASKHSISATLLTYHNIAYLLNLTRGARTAILEGRFTEYVQDFFSSYYPEKNYPQWVVGALRAVNIELK